jgi:hypothetical protein
MEKIIADINITDNFVILKFESTLDKKAKKLTKPKDVFYTTEQAKKLGLDEKCVGFVFIEK